MYDWYRMDYRASHIILDYLQSLNTHIIVEKSSIFFKKNSISLIKFFKMIHSCQIFWFVPCKS